MAYGIKETNIPNYEQPFLLNCDFSQFTNKNALNNSQY